MPFFLLKLPITLVIFLAIASSTFADKILPSLTVKWFPWNEISVMALEPTIKINVPKNTLYIGRAPVFGGMIPGKVDPTGMKIWVPFNGKECSRSGNFEMLAFNPGDLKWVEIPQGKLSTLPENLLPGGCHPATGEILYICRASHQQEMIVPGVLKLSDKVCNIPYGFVEHSYDNYDVLVKNGSIIYDDEVLNNCTKRKIPSSGSQSFRIVGGIFVLAIFIGIFSALAYFIHKYYSWSDLKRMVEQVK